MLPNEHLFEHVNIPSLLLPCIKQSWNSRRNQMITGCFYISLSARGLRLHEYNADSVSCHIECGKLQGLWGESIYCDDSVDAGSSSFLTFIFNN